MTDERRICPPDHQHAANSTCYTAHACRCDDCRAWAREYKYWQFHRRLAGRPMPHAPIDGRGVRRCLQALVCLGWSMPAIADRLELDRALVLRWLTIERVEPKTLERVEAVYAELSMTLPPTDTPGQKYSVQRLKKLGESRGWVPPLAWDDIDTDFGPRLSVVPDTEVIDELAVEFAIAGHRVTLTRNERHLAVTALHARRFNDQEISEMLRVADKTILRDREYLNLPPNLGTYEERFAAA